MQYREVKESIKSRISGVKNKASSFISRRPFVAFLATLATLILLMGISNTLSKPKNEEKKTEERVTTVSTYYVGTAPKMQAQAQVKKTGTITIYAQTAGVVQQVYRTEGQAIAKNNNLLWISTNYTGGTISSAQRQIAESSYQSAKSNLGTNKEIINQQRKVAELSKESNEELRKITERSIDETRGVIETNDEVLKNIVSNIQTLQDNNGSQAQIDALKAQQAQLQSGINQLRNANRIAQYQAGNQNAPTQLTDLQKSATLKQLDLQEKGLDLQVQVAELNARIAQIGESLNFPASPVSGTVERINVTVGQLVNPGDALATIVTADNSATAEVFVPKYIAQKASRTQTSTLYLGNDKEEVLPTYISTQPTNGALYSIKYQIPSEKSNAVSNNEYIQVDIPVGSPDTNGTIPFVPLDAIYQTQDGAYVYTAQKQQDTNRAKAKKIVLGDVVGNYVQVVSGLSTNDIIVLDRNVLEDDIVKIRDVQDEGRK